MFFKQKRKALDQALLTKIQEYLNLHLGKAEEICEAPVPSFMPLVHEEPQLLYSESKPLPKTEGMAACSPAPAPSLSDLLQNMGKTFGEALMEEADRKGISDAALYRKAQVSRATFHKIIRGQSVPGKQIACALVLALELSEEQAEELLGRAGIYLADNNAFDLIIRYCLENGIHSIDRVNDILYEFDQLLVGSAK